MLLRPLKCFVLCLVCAGGLCGLDEAPLRAVLAEAEALGLPSPVGCALFRGMLQPMAEAQEPCEGSDDPPALHARLPDGRWLLHLVRPYAAEQLVTEHIGALQPLANATKLRAPVVAPLLRRGTELVSLARQMQLKFPTRNP